ncbi:FkbM family methyltransferase [Rubinisphaera sp. JC750]|uniref:FkbM family methyltransferase n=1 Tax=Rubinisphaera sp. JC750 TaxID=2898658 RepID=UPI001EFFB1F9|nr:FkbM family methyltransferase [Rubinisphaera sp. JC750]
MDAFVTFLIRAFGRIGVIDPHRVFDTLSASLNVDHLRYAYAQRGILNYRSLEESGELHLVSSVLPRILPDSPTCFDVGANKGQYSELLLTHLPNARLTLFEPNPLLSDGLARRFGETARIVQAAVGSHVGDTALHTHTDIASSSKGTLHQQVLTSIYHEQQIEKTTVNITTLDDYCDQNCINRINFLKLDIEGHEKFAIDGSSRLIRESRIDSIQFEFNEMNVVSRVFLKDFFDLLPRWNFFRMKPQGISPLRYHRREELFQYQNIFAIRPGIDAASIR